MEEELAAREAKVAIAKIGIKPIDEIVQALRKAAVAARRATFPFSSEEALNDARRKAGIALTILVSALEAHRETLEQKDKAKDAIEAWIKELERARP